MASTKRKGRTIAELQAAGSNEAVAEQRRQKEAEYEKQAEERRRIQAPLIADLQKAGVPSLDAVLQRSNALVSLRAIPVLLDHLQRPYPAGERAFMAHLLTVPEARVGWPVLVDAYKREQAELVRDGLANVLSAAVEEGTLDEYLQLVRDRSNGRSRVLLLHALSRLRIPRGIATLREMANDPDLKKEVQVMLRRIDRKKN